MATFTKFIPKFMYGYFDAAEYEFNTQEELLALPCVSCWTQKLYHDSCQDEDRDITLFHQFSLKGDILVVESSGGKYSIEIGKLSDVSMLSLPEWNMS